MGWLTLFLSHLKRGAAGHLLHGPAGNLVRACGGCACADATLHCPNCPDATPTQYHVTFVDVAFCPDCVSCPAVGVLVQVVPGSVLHGTYLLTHNGACAWTAFSTDVAVSATLFTTDDCSGSPTSITFAIQQVRINTTHFRLQVTDDSNTILLFDAIVDSDKCCIGYTVGNGLTACGCDVGGGTTVAVGTGGIATVTPC